MGILFMDGFDFGGQPDLEQKWDIPEPSGGGNHYGTLLAGGGPFGTQCWRAGATVQNRVFIGKNLGGLSNVKILAWVYEENSAGDQYRFQVFEQDGGTDRRHAALLVDANQELYLVNGADTEIGRSSAGNANGGKVSVASWYHIEWRFELSNSISTSGCQVFVDGELWIDIAAGTDTQNGGQGVFDKVICGNGVGRNGTGLWRYDDIVLVDEAGPVSSGKLFGKHVIETLPLLSTGSTNDFTVVGGAASSVSAVGSTTNDGDDNYIRASTAGDTELFVPSALSAGATAEVFGLQINTYTRKSDLEDRTFNAVAVASGSSALPFTMSANRHCMLGNSAGPFDSAFYRHHHFVFACNPVSDAQWAVSEVEAAQFGLVITL